MGHPMAATLFIFPHRALDANANPYSGAISYFYQTGTTTPLTVYADGALQTELGETVTADSGGKFPNIYLDAAYTYRAVIKNASGSVTLHDIDPYLIGGGGGGDSDLWDDGAWAENNGFADHDDGAWVQ